MLVKTDNIEQRHDLIIKLIKDLDKMVFLTQNKTEEDFDLFDSIEDLNRQVQIIRGIQ